MPLPTNIDTEYENDPDNPTVEFHQQHHDSLHAQYNEYEGTTPADFDDAGAAAAVASDLSDHEGDTANPHEVTAAQVDADPAGSASAAQSAAESYADAAISALVDSSPAALDTLNELAAALGDDPDFATTVNDAISQRLTEAQADALYEALGSVESHRTNDVHTEPQPPESHGNEAHDEEFATVSELSGAVPSGIIAMWSGSEAAIPTGWNLCDGTNDTPNLTDRFIVGAGTAYAVGDTGGEDSVTLSTAELPSHDHGSGNLGNSSDNHTHSYSGTTSGDNHGHSSGNLNTGLEGNHTHSYASVSSSGGSLVSDSSASSNLTNSSSNTGGGGSHSHTVNGNTGTDNHSHNYSGNTGSDSHSHSISGNTSNAGSGSAHENRPSYYALAYIMKA